MMAIHKNRNSFWQFYM